MLFLISILSILTVLDAQTFGTLSPEIEEKFAWCLFCPLAYGWADEIRRHEPDRQFDKPYVIKRIVDDDCSEYPDQQRIKSRKYCISTTTTLVNDHLQDFGNHTIVGNEDDYCDFWYRWRGCRSGVVTSATTQTFGTLAPETNEKFAWCFFCPEAYRWTSYVVLHQPEKKYDKAYVIKLVGDRTCSRFPDTERIKSRKYCLSTLTTLVNDHLQDIENHTIWGYAADYCNHWYRFRRCIA